MSSGVLGQLHARPIFSLISDTPDSMKFCVFGLAGGGKGSDEDSAIIRKSTNEILEFQGRMQRDHSLMDAIFP